MWWWLREVALELLFVAELVEAGAAGVERGFDGGDGSGDAIGFVLSPGHRRNEIGASATKKARAPCVKEWGAQLISFLFEEGRTQMLAVGVRF